MILTEDHRVFTAPTEKTEARNLEKGSPVLGSGGLLILVTQVRAAPRERFMFDITVEGDHNFIPVGSGVVVSNCPDKHYKFRPPEGTETVGCYNQVFGYIWTDEELAQYLEMALWKWNLYPPDTSAKWTTVDKVYKGKQGWRSALLWGALVLAAQALSFQWVANEFGYSIGGISLDLEKSSKYQALRADAEAQWTQLTEAKQRTEKYMRGLAQPRFGRGVRSAFGPHVGAGILSPRSFI